MRISDWSSDVCSSDLIDFSALLAKFLAHLGHAAFRFGFLRGDRPSPGPSRMREGGGCEETVCRLILLGREVSHFLGDLHRAEFRAAHRAEVGGLGAFRREGLVVILLGCVGVQGQVELVAPAEFEAGAAEASSRIFAAGWPLARSAAWAASL